MRNEEVGSSRMILVLAVISICVLGLILLLDYNPSPPKTYVEGNFYESNRVDIDPKSVYKAIQGTSALEMNACNTKMSLANYATRCGKYTWIVDGQEDVTKEFLEDLEEKGSSESEPVGCIIPYTDGDNIISPVNVEFINSNVKQYADTTTIETYVGTNYKMVWEDVECWWCHIDKKGDSHTVAYGYGGKQSKCIAGMIIGRATSSTRVYLYKLNGDTYEPASFVDFFFGE